MNAKAHTTLIVFALAVAACAQTKPATATGKNVAIDLGGGTKMEFVLIPAGSFTMGSEKGRDDEKPVRKVSITKPFYFGKYEVTQDQWQAVMGTNSSYYRAGGNYPVEQVSWNDCQKFVAKLKEKVSGYEFRLPTEAEWEYACRAGTTTEYSYGDGTNTLSEYAWFTGNAERKTHPVGEKKPNPWGLYDIHGNVWEWCQDSYGPYPSGDVADPSGPTEGNTVVMRGGSWSHGARDLWSSFRFGRFNRDFPFRSIGLRVVAIPRS